MNETEFANSLNEVLQSLKSEDFKKSFTAEQLKQRTTLPIHQTFLNNIYNILAFINYHSKDSYSSFKTHSDKIV